LKEKNDTAHDTFRNILQNASRLIFLGYGFDSDNNEVLFKNLKGLQDDYLSLKIYATSIGLTPGDVDKFVNNRFPSLEVKSRELLASYEPVFESLDCLDFMQKHIFIRKFFNDETIHDK
jgi:hypothetical protein